MKTYPLPAQFDGAKFATRYSLTPFDYFIEDGLLYVPENLPDDPPIFDVPDAVEIVSRRNVINELDNSKTLRAVILLILDEFNLHAAKFNAILDAIDAATTLPDLKTRVGLIPNYPDRTNTQLIAGIKAKINAGSVD